MSQTRFEWALKLAAVALCVVTILIGVVVYPEAPHLSIPGVGGGIILLYWTVADLLKTLFNK
jgi:uncharacterized membrane protein